MLIILSVILINTKLIAQTIICTEDFSTTTNIVSSTGSFHYANPAGTLDNNDIWNVTDNAYITDYLTGENGFVFACMDDNGNPSGSSIVINMAVGTNSGLISFSGKFASLGTSSETGDNMILEYSINGGSTYNTLATFTQATGSQYTDGTTTFNNTFTSFNYNLGSGLNGTTIKIKCTFNNMTSVGDGFALDEFSLLHTPETDNESVIEENGFNEPDNIAYASYTTSSGLTNANSIKVGSFVIKDGGSDNLDADSYSTILNSVSFSVANYSNIKALALFDGATNLSEQTTVSATATFTGLTLTATDNSTKSFDIYATFKASVTDNQQIQFTVSNTSSSLMGSNFTDLTAGAASTSIAGDDNRIEVSATKLIFTVDATAPLSTNFNVATSATDANNNRDLDNTSSVTLSKTVGAGSFSSATGLTQSLVSGYFAWSDCQSTIQETITIQASGGGLTVATANIIMRTPNIYYVNDASTSGDKWCSVIGNNANNGQSTSTPKLTLKNLWNTYGPLGTNVLTSGDIIRIDAGTYSADGSGTAVDEHDFTINVAGLTFIGAGNEKTIFDHNLAGENSDFFMLISANNIIVEDLQVREFQNQGTQASAAQAFSISDNVTGVQLNNLICESNGEAGGNAAITVGSNATVLFDGGGTFCNADATAYTGGVQVTGTGSILNITNSVLAYNSKLAEYGGGVSLTGNSTINISNSRISNNIAKDGGAIYQSTGTLNITDCIVEGNTSGGSENTYGGAVYMTGGTATYTRVKFLSNMEQSTAISSGGAIAAYSSDAAITLTLENCYFNANSSLDQGNDLFADVSSSKAVNISVNNTTFSSGNAIYNKDATVNVSNSGNPTVVGDNSPAVNKTNTTAPSSIPNPTTASFTGTCASNIALPIELVSIDALCFEDEIVITWSTLSEMNNNFFTIEKTLDLISWDVVATIEGAGISNALLDYRIVDKQTAYNSYYRLKQTDFDGKYSYSKIIYANCNNNKNGEFAVYPIPTQDDINIELNCLESDHLKIALYNQLGQIVFLNNYNTVDGLNKIVLKNIALNQGVYLLKLIKNNEKEYNQKIVIH